MGLESKERGRQRGQGRCGGVSMQHLSGCGREGTHLAAAACGGPGSESCRWYLPADNFPAPPMALHPFRLHKKIE